MYIYVNIYIYTYKYIECIYMYGSIQHSFAWNNKPNEYSRMHTICRIVPYQLPQNAQCNTLQHRSRRIHKTLYNTPTLSTYAHTYAHTHTHTHTPLCVMTHTPMCVPCHVETCGMSLLYKSLFGNIPKRGSELFSCYKKRFALFFQNLLCVITKDLFEPFFFLLFPERDVIMYRASSSS